MRSADIDGEGISTVRSRRLFGFASLAALVFGVSLTSAQPVTGEGPARERNESIERLRQDQLDRDLQTLIQRDQAARDSGRRLDTLKQQLREPPQYVPGTPERPAEMMRNDALRQQQQEYDRALQQRDLADRAATDSATRVAPWRPTGANAR